MGFTTPAVVINAAVDQYRMHGYQIEYPAVEVVPSNGVYSAATLPDKILVASNTAYSMGLLARAMTRPTVRLRSAAYRACGLECVYAAHVALHEVAHLVQYKYAGLTGSDQRIEGIADAVAFDTQRAFIKRVIGSYPTGCPTPDNPDGTHVVSRAGCSWFWNILSYPSCVVAQRRESMVATGMPWRSTAARSWRMAQLAVPGAMYETVTPT